MFFFANEKAFLNALSLFFSRHSSNGGHDLNSIHHLNMHFSQIYDPVIWSCWFWIVSVHIWNDLSCLSRIRTQWINQTLSKFHKKIHSKSKSDLIVLKENTVKCRMEYVVILRKIAINQYQTFRSVWMGLLCLGFMLDTSRYAGYRVFGCLLLAQQTSINDWNRMWIYCIITASSQIPTHTHTHTQTEPTADSNRSNVSNNQPFVKCSTKPWNRSKDRLMWCSLCFDVFENAKTFYVQMKNSSDWWLHSGFTVLLIAFIWLYKTLCANVRNTVTEYGYPRGRFCCLD